VNKINCRSRSGRVSNISEPRIKRHYVVPISQIHSPNSRHSSVSIVTRIRAGRPRNRGPLPGWKGLFFFIKPRSVWQACVRWTGLFRKRNDKEQAAHTAWGSLAVCNYKQCRCTTTKHTFGISVSLGDSWLVLLIQYFFLMARQPLGDLGRLIFEPSRSHSDTPHSVGLLWTRDQPVAETSIWQHTALTRDRHPYPRWDSSPQS
jgi:hypothetical protein